MIVRPASLFIVVLVVLIQTLGACRSTGSANGDIADAERSSASATSSPVVEVAAEFASELPSICSADTVRKVLEEFVVRYNAEDVDGIFSLLQPDSRATEPLDVESGEVSFRSLSMDHSGSDGFTAVTHEALHPHLEERFLIDERLHLTRLVIVPAGDYTGRTRGFSERNADFAVELERWSAEDAIHILAGKGSVDCESGRIIQFNVGRGTL